VRPLVLIEVPRFLLRLRETTPEGSAPPGKSMSLNGGW
jgi:hypothetical protein